MLEIKSQYEPERLNALDLDYLAEGFAGKTLSGFGFGLELKEYQGEGLSGTVL